MKHIDLLSEFRELISQLRYQVESASAMQLYDIHKVSEQVVCGLLRELYGFTGMRNLNTEQSNHPGIDLADDGARVAVQVTATADITKIKNTLKTFVRHDLHKRYDRLVIYILTVKQSSYSQSAIDTASAGMVNLSVSNDIWDYQSISMQAANASPKSLSAAVNILKVYLRGVPIGLADEDIDPPLQPSEMLFANLINIYFPSEIHVAQLNADIMERHKKGRFGYLRKAVRSFGKENGVAVPSAYVVHGGSLITFLDLSDKDSPYRYLIENGTAEVMHCQDFWGIDQDHERVFKSLLRFSLQQRLFEESVHWYNDDKQFVFMPRPDDGDSRVEVWQGERQSKRTVFMRQYNKKDKSKVYLQKHLSFSVDFHSFDTDWLVSITPSWFFSFGESFKKSGFGHDNLSWIKRQENNRAVLNHFRFVAAWLKSIDADDLFSMDNHKSSFISFGDNIELNGAPSLDESKWVPLPDVADVDDFPIARELFGR